MYSILLCEMGNYFLDISYNFLNTGIILSKWKKYNNTGMVTLFCRLKFYISSKLEDKV